MTAIPSLVNFVVATDTVKNEKEQEAMLVSESLSNGADDAPTKNVALSATDREAIANLTLVAEPKVAFQGMVAHYKLQQHQG